MSVRIACSVAATVSAPDTLQTEGRGHATPPAPASDAHSPDYTATRDGRAVATSSRRRSPLNALRRSEMSRGIAAVYCCPDSPFGSYLTEEPSVGPDTIIRSYCNR
jgi:hypothetical protein